MRMRWGVALIAAVAAIAADSPLAMAGHCGTTAYPTGSPVVSDAQLGNGGLLHGLQPTYRSVFGGPYGYQTQTSYQPTPSAAAPAARQAQHGQADGLPAAPT